MTRKFVCFVAAALLVCTAGTLGANSFRSDKVTIPFAFQVNGKTMPAGEYRLMQGFGSEVADLISLKTGERVMLSRRSNSANPEKAVLVFETTAGGPQLKKIS